MLLFKRNVRTKERIIFKNKKKVKEWREEVAVVTGGLQYNKAMRAFIVLFHLGHY